MAALTRRFSPWASFTELQRETDQMMRNMLSGVGMFGGAPALAAGNGGQAASWMPAVDVLTREGDIVVRAELAGVDPAKDIEISVHDGMLTIKGERKEQERTEKDRYVRVERRYGAFERTLAIPDGINAEAIEAEYRDGVLEVVIPGAAQVAAPRRVPVQVAGEPKAIEAEPAAGAGAGA